MPAIPITPLLGKTLQTTTTLVLSASDTLAYDAKIAGSLLHLRNATAGALTVLITGSAASAAIPVPNYGNVSAAGGFSTLSLAAGEARVVVLDNIGLFLAGTITLTGGTGVVATFLQYS